MAEKNQLKEIKLFGALKSYEWNELLKIATAHCIKDSSLIIIKKEDFDRLTEKFPNIAINFYKNAAYILIERLRKMNNYVRDVFIRSCGLEV
jgi:CRP-like cAMP-binding protein